MSEYCDETPKGRYCLICECEGSLERPEPDFDDWYPRPTPCPEPVGPFYTWRLVFWLLLFGFTFFYLLLHVL
jgi:hypothetical protein